MMRIVATTVEHVWYLADNLRATDLRELRAARGDDVDVHDVLRQAWALSPLCWTAVDVEDYPVFIFGATEIQDSPGLGSPWLLATEEVRFHSRELVYSLQPYVEKGLDRFPHLINRVDARNTKTIKWLKYLGFTVDDTPVPHGPYGMPFHYFYKRKSHV